jgi:uncharacterized protein YndB with AHSA1/START domain
MYKKILILISTFFVVIFFGIFYGFMKGASFPPEHVVTRTIVLAQPQQAVWDTVTNYEAMPEWFPVIMEVRREGEQDGKALWTDRYVGGQESTFMDEVFEPPHRLVRVIAEKNSEIDGSWEYLLEAVDETHTRVTLTETAAIPSPWIRFMAHNFLGIDSFVTQYLTALGQRFGETPAIEEVEQES